VNRSEKSQLLQKTMDEWLSDPYIVDCECGGGNEDEVTFWSIQKIKNDKHVLVLSYFTWFDECKNWIEKSYWEMEGPALLNCPIRLLQYEVDPEMMFPEWRYEVKKFHEGVGEMVQNREIAIRLIDTLKREVK